MHCNAQITSLMLDYYNFCSHNNKLCFVFTSWQKHFFNIYSCTSHSVHQLIRSGSLFCWEPNRERTEQNSLWSSAELQTQLIILCTFITVRDKWFSRRDLIYCYYISIDVISPMSHFGVTVWWLSIDKATKTRVSQNPAPHFPLPPLCVSQSPSSPQHLFFPLCFFLPIIIFILLFKSIGYLHRCTFLPSHLFSPFLCTSPTLLNLLPFMLPFKFPLFVPSHPLIFCPLSLLVILSQLFLTFSQVIVKQQQEQQHPGYFLH